jgi:hypothetical protein
METLQFGGLGGGGGHIRQDKLDFDLGLRRRGT